jgi:hypothetical protein
VGHRKGLRENVVCRSSSPINILYNHAASGGPRSLCGGRAALLMFNCPEVVPFEHSVSF